MSKNQLPKEGQKKLEELYKVMVKSDGKLENYIINDKGYGTAYPGPMKDFFLILRKKIDEARNEGGVISLTFMSGYAQRIAVEHSIDIMVIKGQTGFSVCSNEVWYNYNNLWDFESQISTGSPFISDPSPQANNPSLDTKKEIVRE